MSFKIKTTKVNGIETFPDTDPETKNRNTKSGSVTSISGKDLNKPAVAKSKSASTTSNTPVVKVTNAPTPKQKPTSVKKEAPLAKQEKEEVEEKPLKKREKKTSKTVVDKTEEPIEDEEEEEEVSLVASLMKVSNVKRQGKTYATIDDKFDYSCLSGTEKITILLGNKFSIVKDNFATVLLDQQTKGSAYTNSAPYKALVDQAKEMKKVLEKSFWKHLDKEEKKNVKWASVWRNKDLRAEVRQAWVMAATKSFSGGFLYWNGTYAAGRLDEGTAIQLKNRLRVMKRILEGVTIKELDMSTRNYKIDLKHNFAVCDPVSNFSWISTSISGLTEDECLWALEIVNPYKFKQFPEVKTGEGNEHVIFLKQSLLAILACYASVYNVTEAEIANFTKLMNKWRGEKGDFTTLYFNIFKPVSFILRYLKKEVYGGRTGPIGGWKTDYSIGKDAAAHIVRGDFDYMPEDEEEDEESVPTQVEEVVNEQEEEEAPEEEVKDEK